MMKEKNVSLEEASKIRLLRKMSDLISTSNFDEYTLTLTWKVNDLDRYPELKDKVLHWKVTLEKYHWMPKLVEVEVSENIRDVTKALVKKRKEDELFSARLTGAYLKMLLTKLNEKDISLLKLS